ncbi:EAL domain-containing protein [Guyparkeria sp. 1SP6A2]|nr:EAL domain-containing protein [Guyparkeria sp. 1SP6A2]
MTARNDQIQSSRRRPVSPAAIALLYVVYAAAWILSSDWLLGLWIAPEQIAKAGLLKGLSFVAVTGLLLYLLLKWLLPAAPRAADGPVAGGSRRVRASRHLVVFVVNVALVASITAGVYVNRVPSEIEKAKSQLAANAALKADYIGIWLDERRKDAQVLQASDDLARDLRLLGLDTEAKAQARERIVKRFQALQSTHGYSGFALLDQRGEAIINHGIVHLPDGLPGETSASLEHIRELPPLLPKDRPARIGWLVPIHSGGGSAFVLMRAELPALERYADKERGAHTSLLTARDGHILHIEGGSDANEDKDQPWPLIPWEHSQLERTDFGAPARPRQLEGSNLAGQPIVGALHPVDEGNWVVLTTRERAAVLAPLHQALMLLALVAFFLLTVIAVILALLWKRTREGETLRLAARSAEQDRLLRVFYDMPFVGMAITSPTTRRILKANPRMAEMLGRPGERLVGRTWRELLENAAGPEEERGVGELVDGSREQFRQEYIVERPDGERAYLMFVTRSTRRENGEIEYLVATAEDVTREREARRALERQKDLYDLLSQTNQAIIRCRSDAELFDTACRVAVEHGHLAFAWIGLIDPDTGAVEPVARHGDTIGYIDQIEVSIHPHEPAGQGPAGRAIRSGKLEVVSHFQTQHQTAVWHQAAREAGVDAVAAFPIYRNDQVIGAMALYAAESGFFDEAICGTVNELAGDLSFALDYLDRLEDLERARDVVQASPAVLFRWLPEDGWPTVFVSENVERWGYSAEQWQAARFRYADVIHPDDLESVLPEFERIVASGKKQYHQEYRLRMADGTYRWVEEVTMLQRDRHGEARWYDGVVTDIHDRHEIEQHEKLMAKVIENTREGVVITDRDQVIVEINPAFTELTGYTADQVIGRTPHLLASGQHDRAFYQRMWHELETQGHWQGEIWNRRRNGEVFPEILSISTVTDRDGQISHYVGLFVDISRQKENESKLDFLAHHDPLTGLPNRLLMIARLEQLIEVAQRKDAQIAVLMIDLDRFKDVNDSLGHAVGDQLLVKVSERLKERFSQADTIARLGGDEFTMAVVGVESAEAVGELAGQIISAMGEPWELAKGQQVRVLASVGITLYPLGARTPLGLLQQADTALYRAKDEGRGTFRFFSDEMTDAARDRIDLELQLRQAIDNDELRLVFQPQMHVSSNCLHGAEVLVRWQHPSEGLISPDRFIPVAETTGLIWPLGEWVLREACHTGRRWLDEGRDFGRLAVNVSPHQLRHGEMDQLIQKILDETGFPAERLEIELTESAIVRRESEARELLDRLRTMGVHVALDDFGTGYSSLGQLRLFALDVLKIDKRFIDLIDAPSDRGQIARVIIDLGHTLGLKVLAEGVEKPAQRRFLAEHRCDMYQGYLESRPLAPETFAERYLEQQ